MSSYSVTPAISCVTDSRPIWIYFDLSNIWIGSKQLAARESKFIPNLKEDYRVRIHIQESINFIARDRPVADGSLVFNTRSWQPAAELYWLKERGFKREVGTSAAISEITQRACTCPPEGRSTIVIVSGNSDLYPCIERVLKQDGWKVQIHSWKHQTLPKVLENLHCKTNLLVSYLDQYLARITYIRYNFKFKNDVPHNFKQVVLHMTPDPYRDHFKWCKELEDVIQRPFQYYFQIGVTAETDDLVLTFRTGGNGGSFDVDNFLQNVSKRPPAGMVSAELHDNDEDSDDERCPFKFCCQYGVECYKVHTDEENKFFEENEGVGLSRRKVKLCWKYYKNRCPKEAKDCGLAHGEEDALCPNCKKNGHFEYHCPKRD